jgi:hypothetical protein
MAELDFHEPLLVPPDMQSEVSGLQIVQQVRRLVDDNIAVRIFGLVGGPPHMREVSCEAIAGHLDIVWF